MPFFRRARPEAQQSATQAVRQSYTSARLNFAMLSHPGRVRKTNQDFCAAVPERGAFVVCDGMGGAAAGDLASRMAAEVFLDALELEGEPAPRTSTPDVRLHQAVESANEAVYARAEQSPELAGMGTTLVAVLFEAPSLVVGHVGDSRCYLYRGGELAMLTSDHSLVEEQVRSGELTVMEAENHPMRNIITRAVGSHAEVLPDVLHVDPLPGDLYLLATDGLTRELADVQIATVLQRAIARAEAHRPGGRLDLGSVASTLLAEANDAGGNDNITVLLVQIF